MAKTFKLLKPVSLHTSLLLLLSASTYHGSSHVVLSTYYNLLFMIHGFSEWLMLKGTSANHLVQPRLLNQGHLERVAPDHVQIVFAHLQGTRLHNLSRTSTWSPSQ